MSVYDVIIIGAGPAGMTAAIYALRSGKKVLLIEASAYGGQITNTLKIENYPAAPNISGYEFASNLYKHVVGFGADIVYERATGITDSDDTKIVHTSKNQDYTAKTVIIATGAKNRMLGAIGEKKFIGRGVSYCATCDGMFFRGKDVAVVGGGNTAVEDALFLSEYCNKVYVIHRRDSFRGAKTKLEKLKTRDNVEFVLNTVVTNVIGDKKVSAIETKQVHSGDTQKIAVEGLFVAVGQKPQNSEFSNVVDIDKSGYIVAGEDCQTRTKGIFVAGDCRVKNVRQLVTATADGAVSALTACSEL